MDVSSRPVPSRGLQAHSTRARARARGLLPPIQIESTGEPISITDRVVSAIVLALALGVLAKLLGKHPTKMLR